MLGNLLRAHEVDELDCVFCEEQFGYCSCEGVIHCEMQETFRKEEGKFVASYKLILECDRCDEYEVQ